MKYPAINNLTGFIGSLISPKDEEGNDRQTLQWYLTSLAKILESSSCITGMASMLFSDNLALKYASSMLGLGSGICVLVAAVIETWRSSNLDLSAVNDIINWNLVNLVEAAFMSMCYHGKKGPFFGMKCATMALSCVPTLSWVVKRLYNCFKSSN